MHELLFEEEKLKIKKGEDSSVLSYPTHEQSISFAEHLKEIKDNDVRSRVGVFKVFLMSLGMSEVLFKKLSLDDILKIVTKLRGDEKN
jgi:hypothetical protein